MNALTAHKKPAGAPTGNTNAVRLNAKVRAAIAHRLANPGTTWKECCAIVGLSEVTFYKAKRSPHFQTHFTALGRDKLLTDILPDALHTYGDLIRNSASDYVRADLAKDALAQAGVRDRIDGSQRQTGIGSITIHIGARPGEPVRIAADDVAPALPQDETSS